MASLLASHVVSHVVSHVASHVVSHGANSFGLDVVYISKSVLSGYKRKAEHEAELKFEGEALCQIEKMLKNQSPKFSLSPEPPPMLSFEAEHSFMIFNENVRMQRDADMAEIESQRKAELLAEKEEKEEKEEKDKAEDVRFPKSCISCNWPMSDSCSNPVCERKFLTEFMFESKSESKHCDLCDNELSEVPCCRLVVV